MTTRKTDLLATKLHRPRLGKDHLLRQRLLDRLEENLHRPLTLISAPAGYGKTTLLSAWLESCDYSSGWVSLDENDNDLRQFLSYFLAAVQKQFPDSCHKTKALLDASKLPPLPILTHGLVNELDKIDSTLFILVIDDYHTINDKAIHDFIAGLLQHAPGPLYLVLSTRLDPSLPLASLRARGRMTEFRITAIHRRGDLRTQNAGQPLVFRQQTDRRSPPLRSGSRRYHYRGTTGCK
ncbi:MAG: hypothetical protein HKP58_06250 [Desulfatitalea sp.]|nr:hypothetical protein [Desulfatitalea sp.]NNJ99998.1 hypothetical protein [Desulfatitalea sp.]